MTGVGGITSTGPFAESRADETMGSPSAHPLSRDAQPSARYPMTTLLPLDRSVLLVSQDPSEAVSPTPISHWMGRPAIVLLGDPGAGKTSVFQNAVQDTPGAEFVTVRSFLNRPATAPTDRTLFLDGLDEARTGDASSHDKVDRISTRLQKLGKPRFRLSCRATDWLGRVDLSVVRDAAQDGDVTVLRLLPLSDADVEAIASTRMEDTHDFMAEARERGLQTLLGNPETLGLLVEVVTGLGEWPSSRFDLYDKACRVLVSEESETHRRSVAGTVPDAGLLAEAGGACAALICAGVTGVALNPTAADDDFAVGADLPVSDPRRLDVAARRRLFTTVGPERVVPQHRTIAEFLGGRYVAGRLGEGLPVDRVRALLTSDDGGVVSELRGLFAWTVCHAGDAARSLVGVDPYGILRYGAVGRLSAAVRRDLLRALARIDDPWFRSLDWGEAFPSELFTPELAADFERLLRDADASTHLRATLLEALQGHHLTADLLDSIVAIAGDPSVLDFERYLALDVLRGDGTSWPVVATDLLAVLALRSEETDAAAAGLRAEALRLDPTLADADATLSLLGDLRAGRRPSLERRSLALLSDALPSDMVTKLLDRSSEVLRTGDGSDAAADVRFFFEALLTRAVAEDGTDVAPPRLWSWVADLLGESGDAKAQTKAAITTLCSNPTYLDALFDAAIQQTPSDALAAVVTWTFWFRTGVEALPDLGWRMIALAEAEPDDARARELFGVGLQRAWSEGVDDVALFEAAASLMERQPRLSDAFGDRSVVSTKYHRHRSEMDAKLRARREGVREARRTRLAASRDGVAGGRDAAAVEELAEIYLNLANDVDETASPSDRLADATDPETTAVALAAFAASAASPPDPSAPDAAPRPGGRTQWPLVAWFIATPNDSDALSDLADGSLEALASALVEQGSAAAYVSGGGTKIREWLDSLATNRPDILARVIESSARLGLTAREWHVPALDGLADRGGLAVVARDVVPRLLADHPGAHPDALQTLMLAALAHVPAVDLRGMAETVLANPAVHHGPERAKWFALRFLCTPDGTGLEAMDEHAAGTSERFWASLDLLATPRLRPHRVDVVLTPAQREGVARFAGRRVPNTSPPQSWGGSHNAWDASEIVGRQIDRLAADTSEDAVSALDRLAADDELSSYRDRIRHARAGQARAGRETRHRRPELAEVVAVLRNGPPVNSADLLAFVLDHLAGLRRELRHTGTDRYKVFWNEDSHAHVTDPKVEESGRDRLVDMLNERLASHGVIAEPEGHMADDNRCDVRIAQRERLLPIEVKRHYHAQVWTALHGQLDRKYASDVRAQGFGIYLVLWYGSAYRATPAVPGRGRRPSSADEMEAMLNASIAEEDKARLRAVVLDVSRPED